MTDLFPFKYLQELYDNLEKQRPNLFRLASDTDENDNEGISMILIFLYSLIFSSLYIYIYKEWHKWYLLFPLYMRYWIYSSLLLIQCVLTDSVSDFRLSCIKKISVLSQIFVTFFPLKFFPGIFSGQCHLIRI